MRIGEHCSRAAISIGAKSDVVAAAQLMRERHVGYLVVFADGDELRRPVGVVTDRDIVLKVVAPETAPHTLTVADIMSRDPLMARESEELGEALQGMRLAGIRRMPVVDAHGALKGVIAIDDAIAVLTGLLCDIAGSIKNEQSNEWRVRVE